MYVHLSTYADFFCLSGQFIKIMCDTKHTCATMWLVRCALACLQLLDAKATNTGSLMFVQWHVSCEATEFLGLGRRSVLQGHLH